MSLPLKQYGSLLGRYLQPQQIRVLGLGIALLSSLALQLLNPLLLGKFIDMAVAGGATQSLLVMAGLFTGITFVQEALHVGATYLSETVAWTATNTLRTDLVDHCLDLDLCFHQSHTPGELVERVDGDVTALSRFFSKFIIHILGNGLFLCGILIILFVENWRAGLLLTAFVIAALIILGRLHTDAIQPWAAYRQMSAEFFGFLGERLAGREDLRANGAVSYVMHQFHQLLQRWLPLYHKARLTSTVLWGTSVGLYTVGNGMALAIGAYLWSQQAITIGTVYLIFYYATLLYQPIEQIREELEDLQQAEASILRIQDLLQVRSPITSGGHHPLPAGALSVRFEHVGFSYEVSLVAGQSSLDQSDQMTKDQGLMTNDTKPWTLQNLSFHLSAGQTLGILGRTGSGKTTLMRLLLRFYEPQMGRICLSDVPIDQTPLTELRQRVGLVTQNVQLFQTTVRHNLTLFNPNINDAQLLQALSRLGLAEWLRSQPAGLDTPLGSDGIGLSAGEAQLLAFARIFLQQPSLVILDEASSRLDPATEALIEHAIDQLLTGCTGIIIAHRLKTVQRADQILILEHGHIVEYGDRHPLSSNPASRYSQLLKTDLIASKD
jgi:ATP-binding cassette subfamily B protein/ATP-binding cassette subfamily C protein